MKEQDKIPTSKVKRAAKLISTGAKLGGNYVKYYAKSAVGDKEAAKEQLDKDNAEDVYNSLSELKGSALKVAQIMSMDKNTLPKAMVDKFSLAQYSAPPLSYPLVVKTFRQYFSKTPTELFDSFSKNAVNAASIGQVHLAEKEGKKLAVKVQYPGVAESVHSDLAMVKPIAMRMLGLKEKEVKIYFEEVESKLLEETDYELELKQSIEISEASKDLKGVRFPSYYPELSSKRVLTMDWLEGMHLDQFLKTNPSQEVKNKAGQHLWDMYDFHINNLLKIHADPHPGNFLFDKEGNVGVIDFGCVKEVPEDFYRNYFQLLNPEYFNNEEKLTELFYYLEFLYENDTPTAKSFFYKIFKESLHLITLPFTVDEFDFADESYFAKVYAMGEELSKNKDVRKNGAARGSRHTLYINRAYFGLFSLLNQLQAKINTKSSFQF
jgi:predicted unusual protein kinase regulating ubiquinone biosynthesis (AarF/ABC1/UbiB family)